MAGGQRGDEPGQDQLETIEIERRDGGLPTIKSAFRDSNSSDNKLTRACLASLGLNVGLASDKVDVTWTSCKAGGTWKSTFLIVDEGVHEIVLGVDALDDLKTSKNHEAFPIFGRRQSKDQKKKLDEEVKASVARKQVEEKESTQRRQEERRKGRQGPTKEGTPRL